MRRWRPYQWVILVISFLSLLYISFSILVVTTKAASNGARPRQDATPTAYPTAESPSTEQSQGNLATQVFENAQKAANAAEDAQRYSQDASIEVGKHLDTANDLLGLFQNVTAIVGILIPILAVVGGYLGFNQLNEAQKDLEDARSRFEKEVEEKQAELQKLREALEKSAAEQRQNAAKANLALSLLPLGERQYRAQDYSGAVETYRRALELDVGSVVAHYRLGYVYTQSGNLDKAKEHLARALEIEKDFAPALAALGYVSRRIGEKMPTGMERDFQLNEAERLLLRALEISPKLIDDDGEAWWGSLGGLYRRRGQIKEAIRAYEKASEATPNSSYASSNLALLYAQEKDVSAMLKTYERVEQLAWGEVQGKVDNYWGYADLLTARLALGKVQQAEEALAAVFRTLPADSPYASESLLDTLHRLEQALGEQKSAHIRSFVERIQSFAASRGTVKNGASS